MLLHEGTTISQDAVHNEIIRFYHYAKLTRPWKSDPLNSHLYIVKFGFTRESTIFICLVLFKHRLWVLVKTASFLHLQKSKTQISCTVTTQVISAFVFATIVQSLYYLIQYFKPLAICTAYFVLDLVGTSEDRFLHDAVHNEISSDFTIMLKPM